LRSRRGFYRGVEAAQRVAELDVVNVQLQIKNLVQAIEAARRYGLQLAG
jgi:hypothetical protein